MKKLTITTPASRDRYYKGQYEITFEWEMRNASPYVELSHARYVNTEQEQDIWLLLNMLDTPMMASVKEKLEEIAYEHCTGIVNEAHYLQTNNELS